MQLIPPTEFTEQPVILVFSPQVAYTDNVLQLTPTASMHLGFFYDLKIGEEAEMTVPDFFPTINKEFNNYLKVRNSLNVCANTGEAVDDSLLNLLEKMHPEKKVELAKMEFSKRRDEFSDLINKNNAIKKLIDFDTKPKRKAITTTFSEFVKLRNYYTHGKLILKYNSGQYYIQIINKSTGQKKTCGIDRKILTSYIETGTELIRLTSLIMQA